MNRLLLTVTILALFSPGIYAQGYNPKFDEGLDLSEFLKAATEDTALQTNLPLPDLNGVIVKTVDLNNRPLLAVKYTPLPAAPGYVRGPLARYLPLNPDFEVAKDYAAKVQTHNDPIAQQLLTDWNSVNALGSSLLMEANSLDSLDPKLYTEGVQINRTAAALNKERDDYKAAAAAYYANCPSNQPPTPACTNERDRLIKWYNDLVGRIAEHNKHVDEFNGRLQTFDSRVDGRFKTLEKWEQDILAFINKADKYLFGDNGTCTPEQHADLQQAVNDACKVPDEPYACRQWNPNDPAKDCSEWRKIYQRNIDCYNARREINQTCYDGGNPNHQKEERIAAERADTCWLLIQESCLKAIAPSIPGRRYGGGF